MDSIAAMRTSAPDGDYRAPPVAGRALMRLKQATILLLAITGAAYLTWRAGYTLGSGSAVINLPLFVVEIAIYLNAMLLAYVTWAEVRSAPFRLDPGYSVDVWITTYNEPEEIVRATALGAMAMHYPHRTVILDDGRRDSMRAMAEEIGCDYLTRPDNRGAKAGNINNALQHSTAQFVAIFDADHIPQRDFLTRTLGYFVDQRLAIVQTPQDYYNLTSVQHVQAQTMATQDHWHEQRVFFDVVMPAKNRTNSAFWCGSCAVLRREALDSIGGLTSESVIEDLLTTQKLHAAGWRTYYDSTTLAYGIAPDDAQLFGTQRLRWARGAMQILRSRNNPLIAPGLSFGQRLSYFSSLSTYFDAHIRFSLIFLPIVVLFTGLAPIETSAQAYFGTFVPYFAASTIFAVMNQRGFGSLLRQERFTLAKMLISIRASFTLVLGSRSLPFAVTPKRGTGGRSIDAYVLIVLAAASALAASVGVLGLLGTGPSAAFPPWLVAGSVLWAVVNTALLSATIPLLWSRTLRRDTYRFPWRIPLAMRSRETGRSHVGATLDVSWTGFSVAADLELGETVDAMLRPVDTEPIRLTGVVRSRIESPRRVGIELDGSDRRELDRLMVAISTGGARLQDLEESSLWADVDRSLVERDRGA
ncbi:MAG: glycosyltransferase [Dehalococcoidia bacterium]